MVKAINPQFKRSWNFGDLCVDPELVRSGRFVTLVELLSLVYA